MWFNYNDQKKFKTNEEMLIGMEIDSDIAYSKTAFELKVKSVLWFLVHGSQLVMVLWFRKSAVFYLPPGWFGPAQRFLSWPFAPAGKILQKL